jgi:hypothetical protein
MKSLLKDKHKSSLLALALGLILFLPGTRAFGDGDGADILPFSGGSDENKIDNGPSSRPEPSALSGFLYGWRKGENAGQSIMTMSFPVGDSSRLWWQRAALSLATNKRLRGLNFMLGYLTPGMNGHLAMVFTLIEGGQGKVSKFRLMYVE